MSTSPHSAQTKNHRIENFVFANASDRANAVGYALSTEDLGKVAYEQATGTYWRLTATTPAWARIDAADSSSLCGFTSKTGITGVSPTVVLTTDEANQRILNLQGNATGVPVIQVPDGVRAFIVNNALGVAVHVKTATGLPATVDTVTNHWCFIDPAGNCNLVE